jgi:PAS domain S-box-containing protein
MPHPTSADAQTPLQANQSPWMRYALALALVAGAIALRAWLDPLIGHPSVAIFMVAILVGAWVGGIGPAVLCLILLHLVHGYGFQRPPGLWEPNVASVVSIGAWYLVGITAGILSQMRTSAQRRAQQEQIEAITQREQLKSTLSCMADGVIVTDVNGRLTLMNRAAEALTGWTMADANGKPWWEIFAISRDGSPADVESPIDRVLREGQVVHERTPLVLTSRTGQTIPVAYSAAPVQTLDPQITGVVLVFRDESERRQTQLALQDADRRKDEFLATLAHELRNPLAPICMGLELLQMSPDDSQAAEEVRAMMDRQTQHMVRLIDDLLDVSRITRGKLELRMSRVQLADIVRDAVAATRPLLDEADHLLTVRLPEQPIWLNADANRLTQVLTNLLNNAAKFTPREGRIELAAQHSDSEVTVTVSDSGIGIPPEKADQVFGMFTQIHESSERRNTGLGIGLTLVKSLVEMHGGTVEVQTRGQNPGTTFLVRLPAAPAPAAAPHAGVNGSRQDLSDAVPAVRRRILVVDDNQDALESLSRVVTLLGNDVRQAQDGLEALEVGQSFRPDIVLMDLGMPKMNGFDAARRMRQEPWGRELSLVATTGWGQDEDRRRSAEAGFDHHLVKPIAVSALREILDKSPTPHFTAKRLPRVPS